MTLIDSRPGIRAVYEQLVAESGAVVDIDLVVSRLGPPVEWELAHWLPDAEVTRWADRYRELYPEIALPLVEALPGAHAAIEAANRRGRTILITAKNGPNARLHVDRLDLPVSEVFGQAWREGKATVLREQNATTYVGDHVHDMEAAQLAGVPGVGVATGPSSADELRDAGASHVLTSLEAFPDWLDQR
ncbi:MAG: phosphoglycolate phosphatase [Nocardioidaceae bacterium]|nr:phosphoglycolate phosphatase [Nocardioidaceae bacterium]